MDNVEKFLGFKGLAQMHVGAEGDAGGHGIVGVQCGQHDHGNLGQDIVSPDFVDDVPPVELRHHDVKDDETRHESFGGGECLQPVDCSLDLEPFQLEVAEGELDSGSIVIGVAWGLRHGAGAALRRG